MPSAGFRFLLFELGATPFAIKGIDRLGAFDGCLVLLQAATGKATLIAADLTAAA